MDDELNEDLTASDFELLNSDEFFEHMTDMFSLNKSLFPDMKQVNGKPCKNDSSKSSNWKHG